MRVILKDKKDLNTLRSKGWSKDGYKIIGSQDEINRDLEVEVLSVKFSKIGQKTFDAYPNLKWIICRSHGYDNVRATLQKNTMWALYVLTQILLKSQSGYVKR